ncbi:MAG: PTS sugar transporter subunit IIA [Bacteroidetes bacterium]|nr:PTS sugar transporter subunit IIA [Bacteroidota bacterium]MDA0873834.1 PTS sugar transporter subunit IIA [Bacteroidota bacterium]
MELTKLLDASNVAVGVDATDKESLIHAVIDLIEGHPAVLDAIGMREAVFEREATMSTGVGKGLALPHAKTSAVSGVVAALAVTRAPVEYASIDNEPVRIVFLLLGRQDAKSQHVRILSRISRMMNQEQTRQAVVSASTTEQLLAVIREAESHLN